VLGVLACRRGAGLDLDADDPLPRELGDQVDLVPALLGA